MKKIIPYVLTLAVGFALGVYFQKRPADQKLESTIRTDAAQAGAAVKAGAQKADAVAADMKADAQKAGDMATNVAGEVKADAQKAGEVVTNAVGEIKDK